MADDSSLLLPSLPRDPAEPQLPPPRTTRSPTHAAAHDAASSPLQLPPQLPRTVAGVKRPAPSLLPAFEPSSPILPRALNPFKRQNTGSSYDEDRHGLGAAAARRQQLPTPVPTSSTGIMSSSPPHRHPQQHQYLQQEQQHQQRPAMVRTQTSERAPLGALPTVEIPENGEVLMMGRSSNSSHYQLSANRLVSRVHVKARYIPGASPLELGKMEIICNGWNGIKLHCQGRTWELFKGDSFTSETEGSDIILDVQDARVMLQWPRRGSADHMAHMSDSSWEDSPRRGSVLGGASLQSSPLRRATRIQSPESPTPANLSTSSQRLQALFPNEDDEPSIQIYEDEQELELPEVKTILDPSVSMRTEATASFSSDLSDPEDEDPDEENDPVVHSFGPFGANISGRFASISTQSPGAIKSPHTKSQSAVSSFKQKPSKALFGHKDSAKPETLSAVMEDDSPSDAHPESPAKMVEEGQDDEVTPPAVPAVKLDPSITNHVVNQLAWSRLSSTPLSTIMQNLPSDAKDGIVKEDLKNAIEATPAIGIITRQGKDAAGKPLESEYYYVPEHDDDEQRKAAVVDGFLKPSLRNCRKQHKQYYWKRPKTP